MRNILVLSFTLLLGSCATTDSITKTNTDKATDKPVYAVPASPPPPPPKPSSEVPRETVKMVTSASVVTSSSFALITPPKAKADKKKVKVALREFVYRSQPLKGSDYNLVVLNNKPMNQKQLDKVIYICELWKNTVPDKEAYLSIVDNKDQLEIIPFYWPLKNKVKSDSCMELVENYDYERVQVLVQALRIKQDSPQFLYRTQQAIVTMDISRIESKEDIEFSMGTWRENMCLQFDKNVKLNPKSLVSSVKKVLGILSNFITVKT